MKPLVSIIVPVYKVEDCLLRCLESLGKQSLNDIEIILIDDASPDCCGDICEEYVANDKRFKTFHHSENRGLSAARNTGIRNASADYLMFVDSDDWVHEDYCKEPYECAIKYKTDLVIFNRQIVKKTEDCPQNIQTFTNGYITRFEALDLLLQQGRYAAWGKLYSRRLFDSISYPEGYLFEDIGTTYKFILKANKIYYLDKILYYYDVARSSSITKIKSEKALNDWVTMFMQQYNELVAYGFPVEKLDKSLQYLAMSYCIKKKRDFSDPYYSFLSRYLLSIEKFPKGFTLKRKMLLLLFKYCPTLFELICTLSGRKYSA